MPDTTVTDTTVTNWFGDIVTHPQVVVEAASVDDIVAVLKDPQRYPSPVRAVGSYHSTSPCGSADGGTIIKMSQMNRILNIGPDTVTVGELARLVRVPDEVDFSWVVKVDVPALEGASADEAPPPAP